jgi:BCD family chlorophyll transporter-like MFS transporter
VEPAQPNANFGWTKILRLGLVQAALGAIVVLCTSTFNRIMVVELALPALLPGVLVALHYIVQMARPRMGWGSDRGGRSTPWIIGGMAVLAVGGLTAALGTIWMGSHAAGGIMLAVVGFVLIGLGVSASGTSVLVLLAKRVDGSRRAAAAAAVWLMMITGFAVTAGVAGSLLDPYSPQRLLAVAGGVCVLAFALTVIALWRLEGAARGMAAAPVADASQPGGGFAAALRGVWADATARRFAVFVFIAMLAYSAQDLILEPFAGLVLGFTPGESTRLSGVQHGGVLLGMIAAAVAGSRWHDRALGSLRLWTVGGCVASAVAMAGLVVAGFVGQAWHFKATVFLLGVANGAFSIAAIGTMMRLACEGPAASEGVRMGLCGAAQAIAFGLGGLFGTAASDLARWLVASAGTAYASVFAAEAVMFLVAAAIAARVSSPSVQPGTRLVTDNRLQAAKVMP